MDTAEFERISMTLTAAVADACLVAKFEGIGPRFREITRHAREMQDLSSPRR